MVVKTRWGILGTGWIADLFTKDLLLAGHTVSAVGSRSQASADRFAAQFGIPHAHASYEELAADPEVDVIYIATPHPMHAANAKVALTAGKHVLIEKPFTINATQAQEVVALAEVKGLVALEAMWTRFLPHMVNIRKIVASGALGEIRSIIADHTQDLPDDPQHRLNALELGGGALLDLGVYPISLAWDILGEPQSIQATATFKSTGADAQVATLFKYASGAMAVTLSASDSAGPNRATIIGTEGRIEIERVWYEPTSFRVFDNENRMTSDFKSVVAGRGMQFEAEEAERLIVAGLSAGEIMPPSQTVAIMRTLDSIRSQIGLKYPDE